MSKCCVLLTGLPGSGKSTVGEEVANTLGYVFLDKDHFLENLFEMRGASNPQERSELSIEASNAFLSEAVEHENVVLVSHWKTQFSNSGTEIYSVLRKFTKIIEINCQCSSEVAVSRFLTRKRHEMHYDGRWDEKELLFWMKEYNKGLPLLEGNIGVPTDEIVDVDLVVAKIHNKIRQCAYGHRVGR